MSLRRLPCLAAPVLLLLLMGSVPTVAYAQDNGAALLERIGVAMEAGDVSRLLGQTADRVEISLFGERRRYSRAQALYVMQDFFKGYAPERFTYDERSQSGQGWFAEGRLHYRRSEQPLRVYIRLQQRGGRWELRELMVENLEG